MTHTPTVPALEHAVVVASCVRDADAVRYAACRVT